jgi:hypothetical protein
MEWSYRLQPLREPAAKILEWDDVFAHAPTIPTDNEPGVFFAVAAAAHGFGSCSFFELVDFVLIAATEANAFHKCVRYWIINCVAGMRGKVSARPGVISHSPFLHFPPTARTYSCVKELDGLKRRVVARPCIYPLPCARCDFARELLRRFCPSAVIVSQAGKLASKLSPYVGAALIMSCCQVWPCAVGRLSCQLRRRFVVVARRRVFGRAPCRPCGRIR